ncbi:hypothetical protein M9Y10_044503 [Tritrichomonas musculus]|uniref:Uncharacterized protein n=1 Tax=Tritrichomonas musculus TaxID=1915356 RepID=A0ABR2JUE5_9EUKA
MDISNENVNVSGMFYGCVKLNILYIQDESFERIKDQLRTTFKKARYQERDCYLAEDFISTLETSDYQLIGETQSNTTITHYCPIEGNITDFIIGATVYLTGKVYKYDSNKFVPSTESDRTQFRSIAADTTDCICSVKTRGTWKEYIGICVRIDEKN